MKAEMQLIRKLENFPAALRGGVLSIGNFDGVHRGHAAIIQQLKQFAGQFDSPIIIFTFDPHPVRLLRPEQTPPPLTWINRKADLLADVGVDVVVAYPTNRALLNLSYREFFEQIIVDAMGVKAMVEGPNFFFGKNREGDTERLGQLCQEFDIELKIVTPELDTGNYISSSRIRQCIDQGDVDAARLMLTHPYRIRGMVTHGAGRGATIGFPTANLDAIDTLVPSLGVYAGRTYIGGRAHWSAIHIGPNPTFGDEHRKVESHVLDFSGSIYGQAIEIDFISRLRDVTQFASADALVEQLKQDIEATRQVARSFG